MDTPDRAPINRKEEHHRLTLEALADVDAGRVIDHQAVQAWADGLESNAPPPDAKTAT